MVDHLDGDAAAFGFGEGYGGVTVEGGPGFRIDLGLQGGLQALVGVVLAEEVGLAHEEALAAVLRLSKDYKQIAESTEVNDWSTKALDDLTQSL